MSDPLRSPKLRAWHLDRSAFVYVRQSTPQQVIDHQESTARQYALAGRAVALGWARDRVTTIDDDLGKSGQSIEGRPGFQRLLAEVALDHVGLILGLEMSRLARSNRDWHQLLELCARFRVLLADADGDLRSDRPQRQALARPARHDERGGASCPQGTDVSGQAQQGPPRRVDGRAADRLRPARLGRVGHRPRRAGPGDRPADLRSVRPGDDLARPAPLPGPPRDPHPGPAQLAAPTAASWSGGGRTGRRCRTCCTTRATPGPIGSATGRSTRVASSPGGRPPAS